jgi:hypothetical protein
MVNLVKNCGELCRETTRLIEPVRPNDEFMIKSPEEDVTTLGQICRKKSAERSEWKSGGGRGLVRRMVRAGGAALLLASLAGVLPRLGIGQPLHCTALHCTALHCTALHCTGISLPGGCQGHFSSPQQL